MPVNTLILFLLSVPHPPFILGSMLQLLQIQLRQMSVSLLTPWAFAFPPQPGLGPSTSQKPLSVYQYTELVTLERKVLGDLGPPGDGQAIKRLVRAGYTIFIPLHMCLQSWNDVKYGTSLSLGAQPAKAIPAGRARVCRESVATTGFDTIQTEEGAICPFLPFHWPNWCWSL